LSWDFDLACFVLQMTNLRLVVAAVQADATQVTAMALPVAGQAAIVVAPQLVKILSWQACACCLFVWKITTIAWYISHAWVTAAGQPEGAGAAAPGDRVL